MAKIDIAEDVLKHTDEEIIDFLASEARAVRKVFKKALDEGNASVMWAASGDLEVIMTVLIALDGRNKNRDIQ